MSLTFFNKLNERQFKPLLPKEKKFFVWLTHDVDRVQKTWWQAFYYWLKEKRFYHLKSIFSKPNPYWNFERIMSIEAELNVRSTFFFLNESLPFSILKPSSFFLAKGRYCIFDKTIFETIRKLDRSGWEIGLHGSYASYNNFLLLKKEKEDLESIVGHDINCTRQHYLNLEIPKTWEIQNDLCFRFDSSFGLIFDIGFRDNIYYPFKPFDNDFLVIPLAFMDTFLFDKSKGMDEVWNDCVELIDLAEEKQTVLCVLWHQRSFNEADFPGAIKTYQKLIKECQQRQAYFIGQNELPLLLTNE